MLKRAALETAFQVYWNDMTKCVHAKAYWSLLHVTVCIPDICAALETPGGNVGKRYTRWCKAHLTDPTLSAEERWIMRCKVLHQGRAKTDKQGRYTGFAFGWGIDRMAMLKYRIADIKLLFDGDVRFARQFR